MCYEVLVRISPGYPSVTGRLHTRYSPVRRSPSVSASWHHVAPRLACVRPVASVHPEPGSNSSLYDFFLLFYTTCWLVTETFTRLVLLFLSIVISSRIACFSLSKTDCKSKDFILILQKKIPLFSITAPLSRKACAKVRPFPFTSKFFSTFFYIPITNISITNCK